MVAAAVPAAADLLGSLASDVPGRLGLWLALAGATAAVALSVTSLARSSRGDPGGVGRAPRARVGGVLALGVAVLGLAGATGVLVRALLTNDFGLRYVADFSRRGATTPYRLAALWGGMAGSLLFFATVAGVVGLVAVGRLRGQPGRRDAVVAVVGALLASLAALVLGLADPFVRLDLPPVDGGGLPPILEHPAMLYHPPLLYLGLATLAAPFALTVAGLRRGPDADLAAVTDLTATVRRWLLVPWTLLAVGMVSGAHWAYVELGWGGYWAWDPVENTALLPWLAVTLALHAGLLRRSDGAGRGQAAFVCIAFLLALTGTMLTRSGAVPSVHAFAEDEAIGRALAALVAVAAAAVAVLFVRTRAAARPSDATARRRVVDWLLVGQLAVVGTALAVTFVGTIAPLYGDLTGGDALAIEGRYFASFAGPLATVGLALVALVPVALRRRPAGEDGADTPAWRAVAAEAVVPAGVGAILGTGVLTAAAPDIRLPQLLLAAVAGAAVSSAVLGAYEAVRSPAGDPPRRRVGAHVAHAGLGVLLLGVAGTASGETTTVTLAPGDSTAVQDQVVLYRGVFVDDGQGHGDGSAVVADLEVAGQARRPALVAYPELRRVLAETSLVSTPWRDVQVALADATDDGTAVLRIGVHPLQVLVWWGALVMIAAGPLVALRSRPKRGGVGTARRPTVPGHGPLPPSDDHPDQGRAHHRVGPDPAVGPVAR